MIVEIVVAIGRAAIQSTNILLFCFQVVFNHGICRLIQFTCYRALSFRVIQLIRVHCMMPVMIDGTDFALIILNDLINLRRFIVRLQ